MGSWIYTHQPRDSCVQLGGANLDLPYTHFCNPTQWEKKLLHKCTCASKQSLWTSALMSRGASICTSLWRQFSVVCFWIVAWHVRTSYGIVFHIDDEVLYQRVYILQECQRYSSHSVCTFYESLTVWNIPKNNNGHCKCLRLRYDNSCLIGNIK